MSVPGIDVLSIAMSVLGSTPVNYFQFLSSAPNSGAILVTTYAAPVLYTQGSVQPVDRSKYEQFGLDLEKSYIVWYIMNLPAVDIGRDVSGDVIEAQGRRYQLVGGNNWYNIDGWMSLIGVDIGPATGNTTNA
jgi:hypothetical protein